MGKFIVGYQVYSVVYNHLSIQYPFFKFENHLGSLTIVKNKPADIVLN